MSNLQGLDELLATLNGMGVSIKTAVKKGMQKTTKKGQAQAKLLAPVRIGELRNSIKSKVEETEEGVEGKVFTNNDHAIYNEFGTGERGAEEDIHGNPISHAKDWKGMAPQPFMSPSYLYLQNNNILEKDIATEVQKEIRNMERGKK